MPGGVRRRGRCGVGLGGGPGRVEQLLAQRAQHDVRPLRHEEYVPGAPARRHGTAVPADQTLISKKESPLQPREGRSCRDCASHKCELSKSNSNKMYNSMDVLLPHGTQHSHMITCLYRDSLLAGGGGVKPPCHTHSLILPGAAPFSQHTIYAGRGHWQRGRNYMYLVMVPLKDQRPAMARRSDVFPAPEGPTISSGSPSTTCSDHGLNLQGHAYSDEPLAVRYCS